ncbi:MAG: hypothetical protein OEU32_16700 [Acidimicrobiia bacterium]|nr:hypothetical protein [Acidimicrobiia bacterium]
MDRAVVEELDALVRLDGGEEIAHESHPSLVARRAPPGGRV